MTRDLTHSTPLDYRCVKCRGMGMPRKSRKKAGRQTFWLQCDDCGARWTVERPEVLEQDGSWLDTFRWRRPTT